MMPSVWPTSAVSSSRTRISRSVPELGAGSSVSTLSVDTSSSGSSADTMSPTFFSHRVTVPSVTDSPSAGRMTGVSVPGTAWLPERGGLGSGGTVPRTAAAAAAAGATAGREGAAATAWTGAGADTAAGAGAGAGAAAASGAAGASGAAAVGASPAAPITPSAAPTGTVSSSPAAMDSSTPEAGAGISVSTLSVETSTRGSSARTSSPTCLSQRVTVPSVTLSPSCGMVTVTDICVVLLSMDG